MREKLFHRDFTLVVIGQIISLLGNAVLRFVLPLYLLDVTGSRSLFGLCSAAAFVPMVVLTPLGGVVADRLHKQRIMVVLDFFTCALVALTALALGHLPLVPVLVAAMMLLYGISGAYQPAVQASMPLLCPPDRLVDGNAVINQVSALSSLLGPLLGSLVYGAFGVTPVLAGASACFFASAVMELFIHIPHTPRHTGASVWADRQSGSGGERDLPPAGTAGDPEVHRPGQRLQPAAERAAGGEYAGAHQTDPGAGGHLVRPQPDRHGGREPGRGPDSGTAGSPADSPPVLADAAGLRGLPHPHGGSACWQAWGLSRPLLC